MSPLCFRRERSAGLVVTQERGHIDGYSRSTRGKRVQSIKNVEQLVGGDEKKIELIKKSSLLKPQPVPPVPLGPIYREITRIDMNYVKTINNYVIFI